MSPEQKQYYVNKAKSGKMVAMQAKIANNQAKTLQDIAKEEHEFKLNMDAHIRDIVFQAKRYNCKHNIKLVIFIFVDFVFSPV